jgi:hypothetical protein
MQYTHRRDDRGGIDADRTSVLSRESGAGRCVGQKGFQRRMLDLGVSPFDRSREGWPSVRFIDAIRGAIATNGGTPTSYRDIDALRQLVTVYGGIPTQYETDALLREAIAAVGGTPTKFETYALIRELLEAMGEAVTSYRPNDLLLQWLGVVLLPDGFAFIEHEGQIVAYGSARLIASQEA